jgi:hypothetical protein
VFVGERKWEVGSGNVREEMEKERKEGERRKEEQERKSWKEWKGEKRRK